MTNDFDKMFLNFVDFGIVPRYIPRIPAFCNSAVQRRTMSYDINDFRIGNDKAVIQEKINCPMLGTGKHVVGGWGVGGLILLLCSAKLKHNKKINFQ